MSDTDNGSVRRDERLRITEIFHSLQGESRPAGCPTAFIRLTGCPLRCTYCDTEYAFHGGRQIGIAEILRRVEGFGTRLVCVTGGEPLAQPNCLNLLEQLCEREYRVSLETSGALDISGVDQRVTIVMDIKTPASGESQRNRWQNLEVLKAEDQLKFVIGDRGDYEWTKQVVTERELSHRFSVLLSPAWGLGIDRELAEWILQDRLAVRFQIQLHKILWGDAPGH
jgi:7-carboxy-7-deazaguanine synthase